MVLGMIEMRKGRLEEKPPCPVWHVVISERHLFSVGFCRGYLAKHENDRAIAQCPRSDCMSEHLAFRKTLYYGMNGSSVAIVILNTAVFSSLHSKVDFSTA